MCGRFALYTPLPDLAAYFGLANDDIPWTPRYNLAPSGEIAVVRLAGGRRRLVLARWGLVPRWARMINARAETVASKPAFRDAFRRRRCLVPASGFYEWQQAGAERRPCYIYRVDGRPWPWPGSGTDGRIRPANR